MISTHGARLIDRDAQQVLVTQLLPAAFLATPNLHEAAALSGQKVGDLPGMEDAARAIADLGARHVLVKGGHLADRAVDVLLADGRIHRFESEHVDTRHTHGTGCVYSAAITARLARGDDIVTAVRGAKAFIALAISTNPGLGSGFGPTNMMADVPL